MSYMWIWSWDEYAADRQNPIYTDQNESNKHWITVYSCGPEGVEEEICTLTLRTTYEKWKELIPDREEKAQLIVDALARMQRFDT